MLTQVEISEEMSELLGKQVWFYANPHKWLNHNVCNENKENFFFIRKKFQRQWFYIKKVSISE